MQNHNSTKIYAFIYPKLKLPIIITLFQESRRFKKLQLNEENTSERKRKKVKRKEKKGMVT